MAGDVSKIPESSSVTSAIEVPLPPEASTLYREVLEAMNQHELPYAVAGAFALQKYTGISRITKDLDLFMKASDIPAALEYLKQLGFRCETPDPVWLSKAHRGDYFVDLISGMSNAVIVVDDSWMKRTLPAMIAGVPSRIISVEDLLGSKLFVVRRERFDGADIAHIIYRTRGQLGPRPRVGRRALGDGALGLGPVSLRLPGPNSLCAPAALAGLAGPLHACN
jgi:hypothetical protein